MRYPVYPAFTPRITQRLPSREGPRAGVETRERSDEQNMWRFLNQMARLAPHITPQILRCALPADCPAITSG